MSEKSDRLRLAREQAGFTTAAEAAERFGWTVTTYRHHENGTRNFPDATAMEYAKKFKVTPEWLILGADADRPRQVPIVGYVGAGSEVYPFDDGGQLDEIDAPPGVSRRCVAVRVRGDSMFPRYMDGDVLVYDAHEQLAIADGEECVVALLDGRRLVKRLRVEPDGSVTLESFNSPPLRRVDVEWVAPIVWIRRVRSNVNGNGRH